MYGSTVMSECTCATAWHWWNTQVKEKPNDWNLLSAVYRVVLQQAVHESTVFSPACSSHGNIAGVIDREESYSATNPFDGEQQVPPYDGERSVSAAAGGGMMPPPPSTTIVRESQANPFDSAGHSGGGGSGAYGDDKDDLGW